MWQPVKAKNGQSRGPDRGPTVHIMHSHQIEQKWPSNVFVASRVYRLETPCFKRGGQAGATMSGSYNKTFCFLLISNFKTSKYAYEIFVHGNIRIIGKITKTAGPFVSRRCTFVNHFILYMYVFAILTNFGYVRYLGD